MGGPRFYIETYGCWLNIGDSEVMAGLLREVGLEKTLSFSEASVVVINTCAVRAETERKMLRRIRELSEVARRDGKILVVTGCLATYRPALVSRAAPNAAIVTTDAIERVVKAVELGRGFYAGQGARSWLRLPSLRAEGRAVVPIAVGCLGSCAYCVEPIARGILKSYPVDEVVKRVVEAIKEGAKEVFLVAQDAAAYGLDIGTSLPALLREVCEVEGDFMVRVGMMEPSTTRKILDDLLEAYQDSKVYKYLHLPLQSGSDKVLKVVGRRYSAEEYLELVKEYRSKFIDGFLATDIIVGLPGEGDEEFRETLRVLEAAEPDKVHVARFTPRPLTPAASMKHPPEWIKKRRSRVASSFIDALTLRRNERWIGKVLKVLAVDKANGSTKCRAYNYKLVVVNSQLEPWSWATVKVDQAHPHYLKASPHRG
ncbi:MAG: tRNA (N(6)-L-threonylcarbamoyladenosine(37)-C(2))-methylthiotransferase [Candidatus Nezhaarchaeota archaeon]|nr:tRNA (N(6)-L-threonylcarbamoyladenosine(37)-C(2))-methylthiotransferase [Candidatus Nezhaarchaeota archaeon]